MNAVAIGLAALAGLLGLLFFRVPVGIALIVVSWTGLWMVLDLRASFSILQTVPFEFVSNWTLSAVPMFLLMGYVSYRSGLTTSLFDLAKALLWRLPGSLAISSIAACSGFAAVCGSSMACAAAMGRISIPEMMRAGYGRNIACGTVAAGGTIGALIPPSIVLLVFGVFTQTSVVDLFLGGVGIGLASALAYIVVILVISAVNPVAIPRRIARPEGVSLGRSLRETAPVLAMVVIVFGGLLGGWFTTTEAGAVGTALALLIALLRGRLTREVFARSVRETATTCAGLFVIAIGATMLTRFLSISGTGLFLSDLFAGWDLSYLQLMVAMAVVYLILGMFMDPLGAMLITVPIFMPLVMAQEVSMVWFGVFVAKLLETGMITPPFGLNVFVIKSVVGREATLGGIFRGAVPFVVADIVVVAALVLWPQIATLLPDLM